MRRALLAPAVLAALLAGCGGGGDAPPQASSKPAAAEQAPAKASDQAPAEAAGAPATVTVKTFQFKPKPLTVAPGTKVTFRNEDSAVHTATSGTREKLDGRFDLELTESGSATYTFKKAGRYPYVCTLHPGEGMTGEVVVK